MHHQWRVRVNQIRDADRVVLRTRLDGPVGQRVFARRGEQRGGVEPRVVDRQLRLDSLRLVNVSRVLGDVGARAVRLPVAVDAAATGEAVWFDCPVAHFRGVAVPAREYVTVDGDAGADTRGNREIRHICRIRVRVEPLADDTRHRVVVQGHVDAEPLLERVDQRDVLDVLAQIGRVTHGTGCRIQRADAPDAYCDEFVRVDVPVGGGVFQRFDQCGRDGVAVGAGRGGSFGPADDDARVVADCRLHVRGSEVDAAVPRHYRTAAPRTHNPPVFLLYNLHSKLSKSLVAWDADVGMAAEHTMAGRGPFLRGEWVAGEGELAVEDLAEGGEFTRVSAATIADTEDALAAAERAERAMAETSLVERAAWLRAIADGIEARKDELAEVIVREAGKPISSARGEVDAAAERFRRAVEEARRLDGDYVEGTTAGHEDWQAIVKPEPVGTVLCISPYNYPLSTTALQVAPALAAGNAVLAKPASQTPVSGAILAEIIVEEADLPDGAFAFLPGKASDIGDALASDDRVDAIAMTGSSGAGEHVADTSGMVELHMELGGNAPALVFPDADLSAAAQACTKGAFKYAGQRCSAVSRVLAHEEVHDALVERIEASVDDWTPGDLFEESTKLGPLISESQAAWVEGLVEDAVERGATLVCGGERDGRVFEPTLLADVPHDARIVDEEQFGPVAAVVRVENEAEALDLANRDELGLDAAVFTADHDRAMSLAERIDAGAVRLNGAPSHGLGDVPFGGTGASGIGRQGIDYTIESFVERKSIVL